MLVGDDTSVDAITLAPRRSTLATASPLGLEVIEAAGRAPSIHNTQPWSWRASGSSIELYADTSRRLVGVDPHGRNLTISCGTALHHAQVAALGLGWRPTVERWPDGPDSDLLARITLEPAPRTTDSTVMLRALHERRTDRRRFTSWPVQGERLERLAEVAQEWGAEAVALHDIVDRFRVEHLVSRAYATQAVDPEVIEEHRRWTDRSTADGVPGALVPSGLGELPSRRPRFPDGRLDDRDRDLATTDGVVVLAGHTDERASWLATGEALGALWLHAVNDGLSIVPLSQVIEVAGTRSSLQHEVLLGLAVPHLLLRVGWQPIGRGQLPRTPRRSLDDVLRP